MEGRVSKFWVIGNFNLMLIILFHVFGQVQSFAGVMWGEVVHGVNPYSRCKKVTCSCIVTSLVVKKEMNNVYAVAILCARITTRLFTR